MIYVEREGWIGLEWDQRKKESYTHIYTHTHIKRERLTSVLHDDGADLFGVVTAVHDEGGSDSLGDTDAGAGGGHVGHKGHGAGGEEGKDGEGTHGL